MKIFAGILLFLFLNIPLVAAQDCSCKDHFEWVKTTFEENDAGFAYALEQKGTSAYEALNQTTSERIQNAETFEECHQILLDWLHFFRKGHVALLNLRASRAGAEAKNSWETRQLDLSAFKEYLVQKPEEDLEGIWNTGSYRIAVKKEGDEYVGSLLEDQGETWKKDEVKLRIFEKDGDLNSIFYMNDRYPRKFQEVRLIDPNTLKTGSVYLKREHPKTPSPAPVQRFVELMTAEDPSLTRLSESTLLMRIPSFSSSEKTKIDSVINANRELITSTENLILDLRGNGGGSDSSYEELMPFLYSNPVRVVGVELLSTPLNNRRMQDFIDSPDWDEQGKKWAREGLEKLTARPGEFVSLNEESVRTEERDSIYEYPKKVGILINESNGSTAEQFLLAAKQSYKVKLFGTTTFGVLDISNMYAVDDPCGDLKLAYSLSRSMRIPEMTIDSKGIQPDFYLDKSIPLYEWVNFTERMMNHKTGPGTAEK